MAQTSFPFETIDTTESQFSQWARNIGEGVKGAADGSELKPGGDSSGMNVKVQAGQSMVRGLYYTSTAIETLVITTSNPTNPRIDSVVLELDPSANSILLKVVAGNAESAPSPSTLVQTDTGVYQQLLATVVVGAGVGLIAPENVTDGRSFMASVAGVAADVATNTADIETNTADIETNTADIETNTVAIANPLASFITDATTARTITAAADSGKTIQFTSGSATVVTVNASTDLVVGARVDIIADGAGELTIEADGATIKAAETSTTTGSFTIGAQYSAVTLLCVATDEYRLIGNVSAV